MLVALIAFVAVAVVVTAGLVWRSQVPRDPGSQAEIELRPVFPAEGLLVPEGALQAAGSAPDAIWAALEAAAVPVAVEYRPATESDIARYRAVPLNASAQEAMVNIVKALDPKGPTLYRVVLPKGAELAKAAGTSGYRGFSRTGGKTAHAVLKPVAAGGAVAAGWPVLAVAGTVMAVDMAARREQVAHQRKVEAILDRQEERHYTERIKDQRSADRQLSRAIEEDGKVDYRRLERALGGDTKDVGHFLRDLHLSRSAIAIKRKALVADAASVALTDPSNPYTALQKHMATEVRLLEQAQTAATELTEQLSTIELKGRWRDRDRSVGERQAALRAQVAPATVDHSAELLYLATADGDVLQLLPREADEAAEAPRLDLLDERA